MSKLYKHNFSLRLEDLSKTISSVLVDFVKKYDLEMGGHYRVESTDGKYFDGFFKSIRAKITYSGELDIWCSFFKEKKDHTPSKIDTGIHASNVKNITLIPF